MKHRVETPRQFIASRHLVRDAGIPDLCLRADDALSDGAWSRQIRVRDFLGGQTAHFPKGQCNLRIGRKRRMAAGENEAQAIVFERFLIEGNRVDRGFQLPRELLDGCIEARPPAQHVDRFEAPGGNEPRERVGGQPVARPFLDRGREGFMQCLLGQVEVTDETNERGQDPSRVRPIERLNPVGDRDLAQLNTSIGRTSTEPVRADGIRDATCNASFRSRASIR